MYFISPPLNLRMPQHSAPSSPALVNNRTCRVMLAGMLAGHADLGERGPPARKQTESPHGLARRVGSDQVERQRALRCVRYTGTHPSITRTARQIDAT